MEQPEGCTAGDFGLWMEQVLHEETHHWWVEGGISPWGCPRAGYLLVALEQRHSLDFEQSGSSLVLAVGQPGGHQGQKPCREVSLILSLC